MESTRKFLISQEATLLWKCLFPCSFFSTVRRKNKGTTAAIGVYQWQAQVSANQTQLQGQQQTQTLEKSTFSMASCTPKAVVVPLCILFFCEYMQRITSKGTTTAIGVQNMSATLITTECLQIYMYQIVYGLCHRTVTLMSLDFATEQCLDGCWCHFAPFTLNVTSVQQRKSSPILATIIHGIG